MKRNTEKKRAIFEAAVALDSPEQREAYLDRVCPDPDLRAQVEALLQANANPDSLFDETLDDLPVTERPGTEIGRYKLLQQIGEGGMGVVFMAEQNEPVRRKVALKIIKLGMDTKNVVARFEAERQALAMMDHPNIAKVLDAGSTDTGRPYFVMELVKGLPINEYCDKAQLDMQARLRLFTQVCQAIQHAHQKGVIHRDIKPSNILVTLNEGVPHPMVIDFGIAKATNQRLTERTLFTNYAQMVGTPAYMSPEQAEMSKLDVDTRSDVYSLGVLLYELLTGGTPFPEKELLSRGYGEMQRIIAEQEPDRPSQRLSTLQGDQLTVVARNRNASPPTLTKRVKGDLDWIVMRALEKDRSRRYETANGLAHDIQRYLNDEPVSAVKPSIGYQLIKLYHRKRPTVIAAAGITLTLIVATIVSTAASIEAKIGHDKALAATNKANKARAQEAEQKRIAEAARDAAKQEKIKAQRLLYAADMRDAGKALDDGDYGLAKRLLERQKAMGDLRGWEWRHHWLRSQGAPHVELTSEGPRIQSLSVSKDGDFLAVASHARAGDTDGLAVWSLKSMTRIPDTPSVSSGPLHTAFSPTENLLAFSGSSPQSTPTISVSLWNADTRETINSFPIEARCSRLWFSDDGRVLYIATLSEDAKILRWSVPNQEPLPPILVPISTSMDPTKPTPPNSLIRGTSGNLVAYPIETALPHHRGIQVFDLETNQLVWSSPEPYNPTKFEASADGTLFALAHGYGAEDLVSLWDAKDGTLLATFGGFRRETGHPISEPRGFGALHGMNDLRFSSDSNTLVAGSKDQSITMWDVSIPTQPRPMRTLRGHEYQVLSLAMLPDDRTLVSAAGGGEILAWDLDRTRRIPTEIVLPLNRARLVWGFGPEGKYVVTLSGSRVSRWSGDHFQHEEHLFSIDIHDPIELHGWPRFSRNARYLAVGSKTGHVTWWDLNSRQRSRKKVGTARVEVTDVSNDGDLSLSVQYPGQPPYFQIETHDLLNSPALSSPPLRQAADVVAVVSPNENLYVRTNTDAAGGVLVERLGSQPASRIINAESVFKNAIFSPDGSILGLAARGGRGVRGAVHLYNTETLQELPIFATHAPSSGGRLLAFSSDNQRMVTGGIGLHLWDIETGQPLGAVGPVSRETFKDYAEFSSDGKWLGCSTRYHELYLWRAPTWEEIEEIQNEEHSILSGSH